MNKKIVIIGDSLTAGLLPLGNGFMPSAENWPTLLADKLAQHYRTSVDICVDAAPGRTIAKPLVDFGFPQDNALDNLRGVYQKYAPFDLLLVFLGSNDYFGHDAYIQQSGDSFNIERRIVMDLNRLLMGMKHLFEDNMETPNYKTIVVIPPVANTINGQLLTTLPEAYQGFFSNKNISLVNLQAVVAPKLEDQKVSDGIHLTPQETPAVAEAIAKTIIQENLLTF